MLNMTRTPYKRFQVVSPACCLPGRFSPVLGWEMRALRQRPHYSSRFYKSQLADLQPSYLHIDLEPPWSRNARCIAF